jgi:hypothetical protein
LNEAVSHQVSFLVTDQWMGYRQLNKQQSCTRAVCRGSHSYQHHRRLLVHRKARDRGHVS